MRLEFATKSLNQSIRPWSGITLSHKKKKKFNAQKSDGKIMAYVYWDSEGVILVDSIKVAPSSLWATVYVETLIDWKPPYKSCVQEEKCSVTCYSTAMLDYTPQICTPRRLSHGWSRKRNAQWPATAQQCSTTHHKSVHPGGYHMAGPGREMLSDLLQHSNARLHTTNLYIQEAITWLDQIPILSWFDTLRLSLVGSFKSQGSIIEGSSYEMTIKWRRL